MISVAGRNNRYNSIQIDGAVNNDLFAISDASAPGGAAETQPISLDAIEELQLVVSPYDVRQGSFTGGGINAVTRSGSNNYHGTGYYFGRCEALVGVSRIAAPRFRSVLSATSRPGSASAGRLSRIARSSSAISIWAGATRLRGSRSTERVNPGDIRPKRNGSSTFSGTATTTMRAPAVTRCDEFVRTTNNYKLFIRADINLTNAHRLTVRHNYIDALNDVGFPTNTLYYFPDNFYRFNNNQNSTVAQLNSTFGRAFNELRFTYQRIRDKRANATDFPFVRVFLPDGSSMRAGTENFSPRNALDQDIVEMTDDYTRVWRNHTLTFGTHNEFFVFDNLFIRDNYGNYQFSNLDLFEQGLAQSYDYSFSATGQSARVGGLQACGSSGSMPGISGARPTG